MTGSKVSHRTRLSDEEVLRIVRLSKAGFGYNSIVTITGHVYDTVRDILRGRAYVKVTGGRTVNGPRKNVKCKGGRGIKFKPELYAESCLK